MIDYDKIKKLDSHEEALKKIYQTYGNNTLIVAPTGAGKSVILLRIIQHFYNKNRDHKALILVPTNLLLDQFYNFYSNVITENSIQKLNSTKHVCKESNIHLSTIHTAYIMARDKKIDLNEYDSLHIDEIHKWRNSYMGIFIGANYKNKLYGYTATPTNIRLLKKNFKITTEITVEAPFTWKRDLYSKEIEYNEFLKEVKEKLDLKISTEFNLIFKLFNLNNNLDEFNHLGYLIKNSVALLRKIKGNRYLTLRYYELLSILHLRNLYFFEDYLTSRRYYENKKSLRTTKNRMLFEHLWCPSKYINSKFQYMLQLLKSIKEEESKTIIFFENYSTLISFKKFLLENKIKNENIGILGGKQKIKEKDRKEVLKNINEDVIKIILCTSVAEEGLDIGSADLVIFYKPITNLTRLVQRFGRTGRHKDGTVLVLYYTGLEKKLMSNVETKIYKYDFNKFSQYENDSDKL